MTLKDKAPARTVIIGYGSMGRNHARAINEHRSFDLAAIFDINNSNTIEAESLNIKIPFFSDLDDLKNLHFDCIIIATPTSTHFEICSKVLDYKKPILLEKPCTHDSESGKKLLKLVRENGSRVAVGHIERLNPVVQRLKNLIKTGLIGDPIHINITRVGGSPKHVEGNNNVVLDLAVHDFDVLRYIFGDLKYLSATCHSTVSPETCDTAEIIVSCSHNVTASIHVNWITPIKIRTLRVTGTKGVCLVDYILQTCSIHGGNLLALSSSNFTSFTEVMEHYQSSDKIEFNIKKTEPLLVQLDNFLKFIKGYDNELCTLEEGLKTVNLVEETLKKANAFS